MKSKKEIKKWILENCVDEAGDINLGYLDFGDKVVFLDGIKAKSISNFNQNAERSINNGEQISDYIYNNHQEAFVIFNKKQSARKTHT